MAFCPEHPTWDQNPKFTPLSETTSIPTPFVCPPPPPPGKWMPKNVIEWWFKCKNRYWIWFKRKCLLFRANECMFTLLVAVSSKEWAFSRNEQQKVAIYSLSFCVSYLSLNLALKTLFPALSMNFRLLLFIKSQFKKTWKGLYCCLRNWLHNGRVLIRWMARTKRFPPVRT